MQTTASLVLAGTSWEPLRPHAKQTRAFYAKEKFVNLACGRGSGKTDLARRRVIAALPVPKPWPDPIYFYVLPIQAQANRVAWNPLLNMIPPDWIQKVSIVDRTITTIFGSTLYVLGMDHPERIEGVQWDGGIVDEACDHTRGSFMKSIVPAMTHRGEFLWRIGVPKRHGPSASEVRQFWESGRPSKKDSTKISLTWPTSDIVSASEIRWAQNNLDPSDYAEQYDAKWLSASGGIYIEFDAKYNVTTEACYNKHLPIYVGCDFNVDPMSWVLAHMVSNYVFVFDEIRINGTTTQRTLGRLKERYPNHEAGWVFTGDAASRQRTTTSDLTDFLTINNDTRFGDKGIFFPEANPGRTSRYSTVNAALCNAAGQRRTYINPGCTFLIADLEQQAYKAGTTDPDESDKSIGHMSDAFGYLIMLLLPMGVEQTDMDNISTGGGY